MKALVLTEYNRLEYKDVPNPALGPNDVLIKVHACGICGSDVHGMDGSTGRRQPPIIMGHEAAGTIDKLGSNVSGWHLGDRVTFDSTVYCGDCAFCRHGQINLCDNRMVLGVSTGVYRLDGAFAECIKVPQNILYRLPAEIRFEQATLIETLAIALHAVNRTPITLGCTAVVTGAGMVGLMVIQALCLAGCSQVIAVDIAEDRLALARKLGATSAVNADSGNHLDAIMELTSGYGADVAIEAVGLAQSVRSGAASLRKGGHLTLVGNLITSVEFPLQDVVTREFVVSGSCASAGEYPMAIELISSGKVNVDALISATAPLSEGAEWFQRLYMKEPGLLKVMLEP
ncbi:zinc-binding dehydrogenase [Candidatus Neomarinimicrobiota bacterium]